MEELELFDYIEGVRAEDVTVDIEYFFDEIDVPNPSPLFSIWSLAQMIDL